MSKPKKLFKIAAALLMVGLLTGCSTVTAPVPPEKADQSLETDSAERPQDEPSNEKYSVPPKTEEGFSFSEVQARSSRENCWIVVLGNVYDFTAFVQQHPFGAQLSDAVCGKDATETFQENADLGELVKRLEPLYLGPVVNG